MNKRNFTNLIDKFLNGTASEAEKDLLNAYFRRLQSEEPEELQQLLDGDELKQDMLGNILMKISTSPDRKVIPMRKAFNWRKGAAIAAAVLAAVIGIRTLVYRPSGGVAHKEVHQMAKENVMLHPGGNKAMLTLSNGSAIVLDSAGAGTIALQGSSTVTNAAGRLLYAAGKNANSEMAYNTLSTPKGGQYQLMLADGTRVWLNASSSIRFPVAFTGKERDVEITGEAYFEVARDASKPFHVKVNNMTVEVLGTHFNIMAYDDESTINTTLLEGSVKVTGNKKSGLLKPGQQSKLDKVSESISIAEVNTEKEVAWKNGMFMFKRDDIRTIMRQIGRWYNVEISYGEGISSRLYSGSISKYVDASEVLKILELGGIRVKTEGNRITVY